MKPGCALIPQTAIRMIMILTSSGVHTPTVNIATSATFHTLAWRFDLCYDRSFATTLSKDSQSIKPAGLLVCPMLNRTPVLATQLELLPVVGRFHLANTETQDS